MAQQRIVCSTCKSRIAVVRGVLFKRVRPLKDGEIVYVYEKVTRVRCRSCGDFRMVHL